MLKLQTCQRVIVVVVLCETFSFDHGAVRSGKLVLGPHALVLQASLGTFVALEADAEATLEVCHAMLNEHLVDVLTSQVSVTTCGNDLDDTSLDAQNGDVKSTTTQVEDENLLLLLLHTVKTIGNGRSCGLVYDALAIEARNLASMLSCLSL